MMICLYFHIFLKRLLCKRFDKYHVRSVWEVGQLTADDEHHNEEDENNNYDYRWPTWWRRWWTWWWWQCWWRWYSRMVRRSTDRRDFMASRKILLLPPNISSFTSATKYFYISMPTNISSFLGTKYLILYIWPNTLLPLKHKKWEYKDVSKICKLHFVTLSQSWFDPENHFLLFFGIRDKCTNCASRGKKTVGWEVGGSIVTELRRL